jgi:ABC-type transport system involved in cytochrome c biogenesis permease subunit
VNIWFFNLTVALYVLSTLKYLLFIILLRELLAKIAFISLSAGFILHSIAFVLRYLEAGHTPITNLHESLSFFAWAIIGVYLAFYWRYGIKVLGPVIFAFLGNAIFALAFCTGIMYVIQEHQVKSKHIGAISRRLPSLGVLDEINYKALTFGFPLLTVGIITGSIWAQYAWGSYWSWDPKETWSLITWCLYAALLHQRLTVGWRGRKAAIMAIIGFCAILFTFLGVNLLLAGLHAYSNW